MFWGPVLTSNIDPAMFTTAIAVYVTIGTFGTYNADTNTYQSCRPSRARMSALLRCSTSKIDRALAELVKAELITRTKRYAEDGSQLPSEYTVVIPKPLVTPATTNKKTPPLSPVTTPLVTDDNPPLVTGDNPPLSPVTNNQEALHPKSVNQENPPRSLTTVTSPCGKREESQKRGNIISKKSKADNHDVVQTILNMPGIRANMSRFGQAKLRVVVEACQQRGITDQQMISAVADRSFDGVQHLERALSARLEALEVRTPDTDTKVERCRLHGQSDALHCPSCWGVVKAGGDPYEGCEDQRPKNWHTVYAWSPSVKTVTMDETEIEPLNLPAAITAMLA